MLVIIKLKRFQLDIRTWNATPLADNTWDNFKDTFRSAYGSLRDLGDLTLDQSPVLNQSQLMEFIMHAMQLASHQADEPPSDAVETPAFLPPPNHQAKNAFESTLLKKIEEITSELAAIKQDMGGRTTR